MIIQGFEFTVHKGSRAVYRGDTTFGFFSRPALQQQVGLRDVAIYQPSEAELQRGQAFLLPRDAPFSNDRWRMVDRVDLLLTDGGAHGHGLVLGSTQVDPSAWFFKAHFYQDPVWPGSLGLESLFQLLKVLARQRWPAANHFEVTPGAPHEWQYRGQIIPSNRRVNIQAIVTDCDAQARRLTADGLLSVDGLAIYRMSSFSLQVC
jgi:3-hydroxymyristoyl/3-hydroxydecanoyl-(acyl carrier protein) dehydratase